MLPVSGFVGGALLFFCGIELSQALNLCDGVKMDIDGDPQRLLLAENTPKGKHLFNLTLPSHRSTWTIELDPDVPAQNTRPDLKAFFKTALQFEGAFPGTPQECSGSAKTCRIVTAKVFDLEYLAEQFGFLKTNVKYQIVCHGKAPRIQHFGVLIKPVDEFPPTFALIPLHVGVEENTKIGDPVIRLRSLAQDKDVGESITGFALLTPTPLFSLHKTLGIVTGKFDIIVRKKSDIAGLTDGL